MAEPRVTPIVKRNLSDEPPFKMTDGEMRQFFFELGKRGVKIKDINKAKLYPMIMDIVAEILKSDPKGNDPSIVGTAVYGLLLKFKEKLASDNQKK